MDRTQPFYGSAGNDFCLPNASPLWYPCGMSRIMLCPAVVSLLLLSRFPIGSVRAEEPTPPIKKVAYECRFTELPIRIDGKGDDPAWKHAQTIDRFTLPWLGAKERPAKTATKAKLLWDR